MHSFKFSEEKGSSLWSIEYVSDTPNIPITRRRIPKILYPHRELLFLRVIMFVFCFTVYTYLEKKVNYYLFNKKPWIKIHSPFKWFILRIYHIRFFCVGVKYLQFRQSLPFFVSQNPEIIDQFGHRLLHYFYKQS